VVVIPELEKVFLGRGGGGDLLASKLTLPTLSVGFSSAGLGSFSGPAGLAMAGFSELGSGGVSSVIDKHTHKVNNKAYMKMTKGSFS
jgi:hypothetical protein